MNGTIACLDWQDCDSCIHGDAEEGGCCLDAQVTDFEIDFELQEVICKLFEVKT